MSYNDFIISKSQSSDMHGFDPAWMPDFLYDFQKNLVEWACRKGRAALFEDCGLGKTPQQLVWAENIVRVTNRPVLLATPLAVGMQTIKQAEKFGVKAKRTRNGEMTDEACVWVTNYEQLHKYDPSRFSGCVCDESSAIKDFKSERKAVVTEFMRLLPYRLLCTATAAPNDYWELGTSSESLGHLGFRDMLTKFFKMEQASGGLAWGRTKYRFRGHAEQPFWSWVCSWARMIRKPSDIGGDDSRFVLPPLNEREVVVRARNPRPGFLFSVPARDLREQRGERRHSIRDRCEKAAEIVEACQGPSAVWCELNDEADEVERMISDCRQVSGSMRDEEKEEVLEAFSSGQLRRIVIKPKIGAWGLNWQHCSNTVVFPSHSFEQYYQLVRRFYRFGQENPVNVSVVVCEGESGVLENLKRKQLQSDAMYSSIVSHMADALRLSSADSFPNQEVVPSWL